MHRKRPQNRQMMFSETVAKARQLAKVFNGEVRSDAGFSICKGQYSIRFFCQNEHNFFLDAATIQDMDVEKIRHKYKQYRLRLQNAYEAKKDCSTVLPPLPESCWCIRCLEYYNHCLASYNEERLTLVGGLYTKYILYQCKADPKHLFYVSSVRKHKF